MFRLDFVRVVSKLNFQSFFFVIVVIVVVNCCCEFEDVILEKAFLYASSLHNVKGSLRI